MESVTRPILAEEEVLRIVDRHFGCVPSRIEEVKDGWFSCIFRLGMQDGTELILKVAPSKAVRLLRYEADAMTTEVQSMRLIRERTDVPVPKIFCHGVSHEIIPHDYFIAEALAGVALSKVREQMGESEQEKVDRQVGIHLRQLHEIHGDGFGPFSGPFHNSMPEAFLSLVDDLQRDAADFSVPGVAEGLTLAHAHAEALSEVKQPSLVHWDLNDGNIIVDPGTGEVSGYIDFERALWVDPLLEFNFLWPRPRFLEGYGMDLSAPNAAARRNLYELYLALIMVIECYSRRFAAEHETWARGMLERAMGNFA